MSNQQAPAPVTSNTAGLAYMESEELTISLLAELTELLELHSNTKVVDFSHVGEVDHVNTQLAELISFMSED